MLFSSKRLFIVAFFFSMREKRRVVEKSTGWSSIRFVAFAAASERTASNREHTHTHTQIRMHMHRILASLRRTLSQRKRDAVQHRLHFSFAVLIAFYHISLCEAPQRRHYNSLRGAHTRSEREEKKT